MDGLTGTGDLTSAVKPQYATYSSVSNQFRRIQSSMFKSSRSKPLTDITVSRGKFIPKPAGPMNGFDAQRKEMVGMGEFVTDPMQNFGMAKLDLEGRSYSRINRTEQRNEGNRYRSRGISAYRKAQ